MHRIIFDLRKPLIIKNNKFKVEVFVDKKDSSSNDKYDGWVNFTRKNVIHLEIPELGTKYTVQMGELIKEPNE